jgi:pimeloyl-ACP methyl ester carboxylesterase
VSKRKLIGMAAASAGGLAAAVVTGLVVERRVVRSRRGAASEIDRLGGLRSEPRTVTASDGLTLHAEVDEVAPYDEGQRHRPGEATVVLVHGYALNLDCWHFQREHLRGRRRLVLFDQRSHGRSEKSERDNASIDQLGHDLKAVLDTLAPEGPVVLVGHSMGGMALMAFAEHYPEQFGERVIGVGLIATTAGGLHPHRIVSKLIPDRLGGSIGARLMAALSRAPELVDSARRTGSNIGYLVTDTFAFGEDVPASYVSFVDEMLAGTPFEVLAEFFPNFEALDKFNVLAAFATVPTTIVSGTKDVLTSIGHSRKMHKHIEGSHLVEVRGAGHMVILERADSVNAAIDALIKDAEAGAATAGPPATGATRTSGADRDASKRGTRAS